MNKYQLLKEKLFVLDEKLEIENKLQKEIGWNTAEFKQSVERELTLLNQKKSVLNDLHNEIEIQLSQK